jgi:hypothetical protein
VIGENETGFRGTRDEVYRVEAWDFMIAGGGLFNNLDYSFTVDHEDGTFQYPVKHPGGGGVAYRRQLRVLCDFLNGFDFVRMSPSDDSVVTGRSAELSIRVLAEAGKQYAIYIHNSARPHRKDKAQLNVGEFQAAFTLAVPAGDYRLEWIEPATGKLLLTETKSPAEGSLALVSPHYPQDLALRLSVVGK